eukprot:12938288-Prorocentrum_lima.AAC.1
MPSHTPQFLGLLVEVAVDQLVHEVDPDHLVVLNVLGEVPELLLPELPSLLVKGQVLEEELSNLFSRSVAIQVLNKNLGPQLISRT